MSLFYLLTANGDAYSIDSPPNAEAWEERWQLIDAVHAYRISTVFLFVDHHYWDGRPIIFETIVFAPEKNPIYLARYHDIKAARAGHESAKAWVESGFKEDEE